MKMQRFRDLIRPGLFLAALLPLFSACAMLHPIRLAPELPSIKKSPARAVLTLHDPVDARPKQRAPEVFGNWRNHHWVFDRPVVEKFGQVTQDLLESAGYKVARADDALGKGSGHQLKGKLEAMECHVGDTPFTPPLICNIRLRLVLEKDGQVLAQETLDVDHQRRGFAAMSDESVTRIINETFEKFLDQAADFVESEDFTKAMAGGKP